MESLIQYREVTIQRKENIVLTNVNFDLYAGEFLYIIGKVGSGKSSLIKTIYREISILEGSARVLDYDLFSIKTKEIPLLRRSLGIVFQDFQLLTDRTVYANLEFVLRATGWNSRGAIKDRITEVLQLVGMETKDYKMPHELSGGEQQRVVIARALLNTPQIILADEPTGNLDPETGKQIVKLLQDICSKGTSVIMITHNIRLMRDFKGRVLKCYKGSLVDSSIEEELANQTNN